MSRLSQARDAVRPAMKGRLLLAGPPGSGKTRTALMIATALAEGAKPLVIDTEEESALTYADDFDFTHLPWQPPYNPRELSETLHEVGTAYPVVIIDSLTHFWRGEGGTLDIAAGKFTGWKAARPAQHDMLEAILRLPAHAIVCVRSKVAYSQTEKGGRQVVEKLGMAHEQDDTLEYEVNVSAELDMEHRLSIAKTRCAVLGDRVFPPGERHISELAQVYGDWLRGGEPTANPEQVAALKAKINDLPEEQRKICKRLFVECFGRPENLLASRLGEASAFVAEYEKTPDPPAPAAAPEAPPTNGTKAKAPNYAKDLHIRASKVFDGDKLKVVDAKLDALVLNVTGGRTTSTGALNETEAASVATWLNDVQDGRVRVDAENPAEGVTLWVGDTPTFFPRSEEGFLVPAESLS